MKQLLVVVGSIRSNMYGVAATALLRQGKLTEVVHMTEAEWALDFVSQTMALVDQVVKAELSEAEAARRWQELPNPTLSYGRDDFKEFLLQYYSDMDLAGGRGKFVSEAAAQGIHFEDEQEHKATLQDIAWVLASDIADHTLRHFWSPDRAPDREVSAVVMTEFFWHSPGSRLMKDILHEESHLYGLQPPQYFVVRAGDVVPVAHQPTPA